MFIDEGMDAMGVMETEKAHQKIIQIEIFRVNLN